MKYIVYKTTNVLNGYIYIGVHKTLNPESFDGYLGCGVRVNKPTTYEKAKTCFQLAVKQFGCKNFKREVIAIFDTAEEAYELEGIIVNENFLARSDVYNMILGGQVNHAKGRAVYQYNSQTGEFEKEYESAAKAAEVLNCTGQTVTRGIKNFYIVKGVILSYLKQIKIDTTPYLNDLTPKIVYRYKVTGEFDTEFKSLSDAGKNSLNTSAGYILKSAILGYMVKDSFYFSFYKESSYDKARSKQILNRKVFQYDSNGRFLQEYDSQKEAELKNPYCNITNSIKSKKPDTNGNYWALEKLTEYNKPIRRVCKKVGEFNENGELLRCWNSVTSCAKEVGYGVKQVLMGNYKFHKGLIYKYIE